MKMTFKNLAEELGFTCAHLNEALSNQGIAPFTAFSQEIDDATAERIRSAIGSPPFPKNLWIKGVAVGGFKAFAREQQIPLGRITLVFGPNSAGKSSLLHSLLLAHEAVTTGELDVHEPDLAEGSIDLGGFHQFIHCQRTEDRSITLEFVLRPNELNEMFNERSGGVLGFTCETAAVRVVLGLIPSHATDDRRRGQPAMLRLDIVLDGKVVCQVGRSREGRLRFRSVDLAHPFFMRLGTDYADLLRPVTAKPGKAGERVIRILEMAVAGTTLTERDDSLFPNESSFTRVDPEFAAMFEPFTDPEGLTDEEHIKDFEEEEAEALEQRQHPSFSRDDPDAEVVEQLMNGFSDMLGELVRTACAPIRCNLEKMTYLGPLRSFPDRDFTLTQSRDAHWHSGGGFAWDVLAKDAHVRSLVNEWFASDFIKTPYQFVVSDLVSGEIVSSAIETEFSNIVQEKNEEHEKKRASNEDKDQEGFYFPYDAWDTDELGKRLSGKAIERAKSSRRTELRLIDKRTGAKVSHRDVGVGLSQILPILVRAFADVEKLHLIEQPEIHVHPALQGELADVFINSALGSAQNRLLVETHSEHLILRILKRVRQTSAGEVESGKLPVSPEDIAVIYVEPTKEGSKLHHLRITPDGDFADRWPNGFFAERGAELFT